MSRKNKAKKKGKKPTDGGASSPKEISSAVTPTPATAPTSEVTEPLVDKDTAADVEKDAKIVSELAKEMDEETESAKEVDEEIESVKEMDEEIESAKEMDEETESTKEMDEEIDEEIESAKEMDEETESNVENKIIESSNDTENEERKPTYAELEELLKDREQRIVDLENTNNNLYREGKNASEGRALDKRKYELEKQDWMEEKAGLEVGGRDLDYELQARDNEIADKNVELERLERRELVMLTALDQAKKRESALKQEQQQQPQQQQQQQHGVEGSVSRRLKREIRRYKDELIQTQDELARVRAENNRLNLEGFPTATGLLQHYRDLLDPETRLRESMVAMASYADGEPGTLPPSEEQVREIGMFRDFLEERAEVLRRVMAMTTTMTTEDPDTLLEEFDEKWEAEADSHGGWGALCKLQLCAVRAVRLLRSAKDSGECLEVMNEMNESVQLAKQYLGDAYQSELAEEINDLADEIRHRRRRGEALPVSTNF